MQLEVFDRGSGVGTLTVTQTGLYRTVSCSVTPVSDGILRLYVWSGMQEACLGVLCPEDGAFTLRRRCSPSLLPFEPETAVIGAADGGFLPWRGRFEEVDVPHGYLRHTPEGDCLAVPCKEDAPCPFDRPGQTERKTVCGLSCWALCPWKKPPQKEPPAEPQREVLPEKSPEKPAEEPLAELEPPVEEAAEKASEPPDEPQTRFHAETVL